METKYNYRVLRTNPMSNTPTELIPRTFTIMANNLEDAIEKADKEAFRIEISSVLLVQKTEIEINGKWVCFT
jgi:hypothetical protein